MAKKKRGNGEGSIRQRKNGEWEGRITIGIDPTTGKPKRASFYGKTRQEVAGKMAAALNQVHAGNFIERNRATLGQWLERWMEVYQTEVSPNFRERRKDLIRLNIKPALGNIELQKLKPADIKAFYNQLARSGRRDGSGGLSTGTIRHIHNILNPALKQAAREGLISKNPCADVSPPRIERTRQAKPLTKDQARRYLEALREDRLYAAFLLDLVIGLRRGELLGLQWQDFNPDTGELKIRRQLTRIRLERGGSSLEYAALKTPASYRTVILPNVAIIELKVHRKRQLAEELLAGSNYNKEEGLIFCTPLGKKLDTRRLYHIHCQALKDAKLEHMAFHDLRHTCATLLLQAGENIKTIQSLLGHSDIETTLNCYSHVLDDMKKTAADKLDSIYKDVLAVEDVNTEESQVIRLTS